CYVDVLFCFFFFSSRRRHTRWPRDWSSDVCSSDLLFFFAAVLVGRGGADMAEVAVGFAIGFGALGLAYFCWRWTYFGHPLPNPRSEERRVGKEGRARWWTY